MRGLDAVRRKCQPPLPEKHRAGHGVLSLYQVISNLLIFPWTRLQGHQAPGYRTWCCQNDVAFIWSLIWMVCVTQTRYGKRLLLRCSGRGLAGMSWYFLDTSPRFWSALSTRKRSSMDFVLASCVCGVVGMQEKLERVCLKGKRPQKIEEGWDAS